MATENEFAGTAAEIAAMVKKKNEDYGGSYYKLRERYGHAGFLIRLADKTGRLDELLSGKGKKPVSGETVEDTIKDVVGYCLLELQYRKNEKKPASRPRPRSKKDPQQVLEEPAAGEETKKEETSIDRS